MKWEKKRASIALTALRPWRFLAIAATGREQFAAAMTDAAKQQNAEVGAAELKNIREKLLRAPLILTAIVRLQSHPKVPETEQWLSVGAATQNILLIANAMGYGGIWLTGPYANHSLVKANLGLAATEHIAGFIHLGTPMAAAAALSKKIQRRPQAADLLQNWPLS